MTQSGEKKRIAVTGANGFIGRHTVKALQQNGTEVLALSRKDFDIHAENTPSYEQIGRPDAVLHLAWGGLSNYRDRAHFETELPAHYRFLKHLVETGLPALVAVGTCQEYGMKSGALSEDMPADPHMPYGFAKDTLRRQLQFLQKDVDFNLTWSRLFYTYGAGQPRNSLLPQLEVAAKSGAAEFNMSGGAQLRDYLPVETVAAHLAVLALRGGDDGIVNLCSGAPVAVRDLVAGWIAENNWKIRPNLGFYPYPDYEEMEFWGKNDKLQNILREEENEPASGFQTGM